MKPPRTGSAKRPLGRLVRPLAVFLLFVLLGVGISFGLWSVATPTHTHLASDKTTLSITAQGYWTDASDGGIFSYGGAQFHGSTGAMKLNKPVVSMAATPTGGGYWLVATDGGIFAFGNAQFYGSMGAHPLNQPVVGMTATPTGHGYWLVAADGGIFSFGAATFHGSMGGKHLNQPIVGITATPTGSGYWMVAADGGIFAFGSAQFYGSMGNKHLNEPITAMAADPTGGGYWMVATDGGIFAFGNAAFYGSMGGKPLNKPIVGMAATPTGGGYWMVASDGGIFSFGTSQFHGSMGGKPLNKPMVGMAARPVQRGQDFTIGGNITTALFPGSSGRIDLSFTNPNRKAINIPGSTITVSVSTAQAGCTALTNFAVVHGLTGTVTVPAYGTVTLSQQGIPESDWPEVAMIETGTNQDACKGAHLTLHYTGSGSGR